MSYLLSQRAYGSAPRSRCFWTTTVEERTWPQVKGSVTCTTAVIGAGFTGLSAAMRLASADVDVVVLEAQTPGWGASGRNGGFCCLGGAAVGASTIARRYGLAASKEYARAERDAVAHVGAVIDTLALKVDRHSNGETLLAHAPSRVSGLSAHADAMTALYGATCTLIERDALPDFGLGASGIHGALTVDIGFALNPLKYTLGLAEGVIAAGARIFANSGVTSVSRTQAGKYLLRTARGDVICDSIVFATNGYTGEDLVPGLKGRFLPSQSHILVTRPLTDDELTRQGWTSEQMCYDTLNFLHYIRLMPDRRFLFGVRGNSRADEQSAHRAESCARADFERMFPAWSHVETPHFWSGLICGTMKRLPYVGPVDGMPGAYAAFAYHGNGVAMGSYCGKMVADLILGNAEPPAAISASARKFPFSRSRWLYLEALGLAHRLGDKVP